MAHIPVFVTHEEYESKEASNTSRFWNTGRAYVRAMLVILLLYTIKGFVIGMRYWFSNGVYIGEVINPFLFCLLVIVALGVPCRGIIHWYCSSLDNKIQNGEAEDDYKSDKVEFKKK